MTKLGDPLYVPSAAALDIESILGESRVFPPPAAFAARARIGSESNAAALVARADADPEAFWAQQAKDLVWREPWAKVLDWQLPFAKWFVGGKLNVNDSCVDRHADGARADKVAILWEGEPGDTRRITYRDLKAEVCRAANALERLGVKAGDRVAIYLPMIPETAYAMLACARIGATHTVVFAGFSADSLAGRIQDCQAKVLITADSFWRKGKRVPTKSIADDAAAKCPTIEKTLVVRRTGEAVGWDAARDVWWHEAVGREPESHSAPALDSEHPLFILYTSGTTGKPKGVVHSTGGYLTQVAWTHREVFDLREDDVWWCTADVGWVTGHSYLVYGPLANGATVLMYEGAPTTPGPDRFWALIEKYKVSILYTAPTAIRSFIRLGDEHPNRHDLTSLRLLGTVGEPINPEAWMWYRRVIGGDRCPIVDTWWQTETGAILVSPLPGATPAKPGSCTRPLPGIALHVVDKAGNPVGKGKGGYLAITKPWPAMLRGVWGDPERYQKQYWSDLPGTYFTGDGARFDADGYLWVMGRVDDVINVAGHRLGTMEIESALVSHPAVAEAAVVGRPDELKGTGIVAFVTLKKAPTDGLRRELTEHVAREIGALARPDAIRFADALPKTRSGKIMRRLLRELAGGGDVKGDTTTLEDIGVLATLRDASEED